MQIKKRHTKHIISWFIVIILAIAVFYISTKSSDTLDNNLGIVSWVRQNLSNLTYSIFGYNIDISPIGHFTEFLLLGAALYNALRLHLSKRTSIISSCIICSLYGVLDEIHQLFVPTRTCDFNDWIVDTIAACLGVAIMYLIINKINNKKQNQKVSLA